MKQMNEAKFFNLRKLGVLAVALAFGASLPAYAASTPEEMKQRIDDLETMVKEQRAEFNRIQVKVEGMEDQHETLGMKDLKISGMMDPTFIYNKARDSSGFNFLSNFDARNSSEIYAYDNSYFGQAMLQFDKGMDGGTKYKLVLAPHKSTSSGYNVGSIVHEANVSMPLTDEKTRFLAGQFADWSGYEYYFANQNKLVSHNLLFDFAIPSFYTGAGVEFLRGKWDIKALIANMNKVSHPDAERSQIFTYRVDYAKGEYSGFGFAGQHGKLNTNQIDMFEVDGYFIRGDLTLQGHLGGGQWKKSAFNGEDAVWAGISTLIAYKFTPRFEGVARLDYLKNDQNGGGTIGTAFNCVDTAGTDPLAPAGCDSTVTTQLSAGDYRNGFGPSAQDATDYANGVISSINGANRSTLTLGMNYAFLPGVMMKAEYRVDRADIPVFYYVEDGSYKSENQMIGLSTVVSF